MSTALPQLPHLASLSVQLTRIRDGDTLSVLLRCSALRQLCLGSTPLIAWSRWPHNAHLRWRIIGLLDELRARLRVFLFGFISWTHWPDLEMIAV
jgi:hypothetical protein